MKEYFFVKPIDTLQSNFRQKQNLQKLLFPRGLQYDRKKDDYRTEGMNRVFSVIADISTDSGENKNGNNSKKLNYSRSVQWVGQLSYQLTDSLRNYEQMNTSKNKFVQQ